MVELKATDSGNLDKQQQVKIRKLLRSADPDHVNLAVSLLEEIGNEHDFREALSITMIRKLVTEACRSEQSAGILNYLATGVLRAADNGLLREFFACLEGKSSRLYLPQQMRVDLLRILIDRMDRLELKNLVELGEAEAVELANHVGSRLDLSGLEVLSAAVATALAKHRGDSLWLDGLVELSPSAARKLASYGGSLLSLAGLTSLSKEVADALGNYRGAYLDLRSVGQLSRETLEDLQEHRGLINLSGLAMSAGSDEQALAAKLEKRATLVWLELCEASVDPFVFTCKRSGCHMGHLPTAAFEAVERIRKDWQLPVEELEESDMTVEEFVAASAREQKTKIIELLKSKHAADLRLACELLKGAGVTGDDWLKMVSLSRLRNLINAWDVEVWNTLVDSMNGDPRVFKEISEMFRKRVNYSGDDYSVYRRYSNSLDSLVPQSSDDVKALIHSVLDSRVKELILSSTSAELKKSRK